MCQPHCCYLDEPPIGKIHHRFRRTPSGFVLSLQFFFSMHAKKSSGCIWKKKPGCHSLCVHLFVAFRFIFIRGLVLFKNTESFSSLLIHDYHYFQQNQNNSPLLLYFDIHHMCSHMPPCFEPKHHCIEVSPLPRRFKHVWIWLYVGRLRKWTFYLGCFGCSNNFRHPLC